MFAAIEKHCFLQKVELEHFYLNIINLNLNQMIDLDPRVRYIAKGGKKAQSIIVDRLRMIDRTRWHIVVTHRDQLFIPTEFQQKSYQYM